MRASRWLMIDLPRRRAVLRAERAAADDRDAQRLEEAAFDDPLIGLHVALSGPSARPSFQS